MADGLVATITFCLNPDFPDFRIFAGYFYIPAMSRRTAQLFDLMFKSIIKDASSSAVVLMINYCLNPDDPDLGINRIAAFHAFL